MERSTETEIKADLPEPKEDQPDSEEAFVSEEEEAEEGEEEYEEEESAEIDVSNFVNSGVNEIDAVDGNWSPPVYDESPETASVIGSPTNKVPSIPVGLPPSSSEKGKGPYFCDICCKTFTNYGSYRRHLRMHYCDKKYTCHLCGRQFFRRYLWVKHQEKIHGNDPSSCRCPHCGDWSQSPDDLREHLRTQHKRTNGCKENWTKDPSNYSPKKSPVNSVGPGNRETIVKKERKRKKEPKSSKIVLPKDSEENSSSTKAPVIKIKLETFTCYNCDFVFPTEDELNDHCAQEHSGTKNTSRYGRRRKQRVLFNADTYGAAAGGSKRIRKSSESIHVDEQSLSEANEVSFSVVVKEEEQEALNDYIGDEESKKEEEVSDSMLSKLLQQPLPHSLPKNQSHRGNFYCEKCRRFFINRSSYMRHKKMHTGVKPFTCEYCCLSFFRSESLTTHKKKHSKDEVPEFRCYMCGYKAANCASLRNHFYTVCCKDGSNSEWISSDQNSLEADGETSHNGERKKNSSRNIAGFCSLCNRAFFNLSNYERHAKLHSAIASMGPSNTSYACGICKKSFTNKTKYDEHVLAHSKRNTALDVLPKDVPTSLELLKQFGNFNSATGESSFAVKEEMYDQNEEIGEEEEEDENEIQSLNPGLNKGHVFCCRLCPLAFTDRKTYTIHTKTHRRSESPVAFYCRYCGRPHKSKQDVADHEQNCYLDRRSENKLHDCYNCNVHFDNGSALREHVKAAHLNDRIALSTRSKRKRINKVGDFNYTRESAGNSDSFIRDNPSLELERNDLQNADDNDPNSGRYKCGKCNETFSGIQLIFSHFQSVHGVTKLNEALSNNKIDTTTALTKSNSTASANQETNGSVSSISRKTYSSSNADRHSQTNGGPSTSIMKQLLSSPPVTAPSFRGNGTNQQPKRNFSCNLCLKAFDDPRVAEAHEQQAHVMVDWYRCAICDKSGSKKTLVRHMTTHMLKVGSVVTTMGDPDSEDEENGGNDACALLERDHHFPEDKSNRKRNASVSLPFVSMFCQLCKKVISSLATLERHRHAAHDPSVTFPYICCISGCGKSFALKVEALAHLQMQHRSSPSPPTLSPSNPSYNPTSSTAEAQRGRWFKGNSWKGLVAGGVGPFSQSLVQLSMAAAGNEGSSALRSNAEQMYPKEDGLLDIYQTDMLENLASNGELTITKVSDVEEITVEPLVDVVRQVMGSDDSALEDHYEDIDGESDNLSLSPPFLDISLTGDHQEYLEEGELVIEESSPPPPPPPPPPRTDEQKVERVLLKCEDCHSVFTNPCSWKRHRKLHLGIMKHSCPHCPRMFYRKDHCDKHVKTHDGSPRKRKSPLSNKFESEIN